MKKMCFTDRDGYLEIPNRNYKKQNSLDFGFVTFNSFLLTILYVANIEFEINGIR